MREFACGEGRHDEAMTQIRAWWAPGMRQIINAITQRCDDEGPSADVKFPATDPYTTRWEISMRTAD